MKTVCEIDKCVACMACVATCTKSAIMIYDNLSSYNAHINENKCVNCGRCVKVCQQNEIQKKVRPQKWYQGWSNVEEIRKTSSSGGIATAIMLAFIETKGYVCSCVFENGNFVFKITDTKMQIKKYQGSKYVKSTLEGNYLLIKEKLMQGKNILFVGLPCQVSGLKNFVGEKLSKNLYTIDLICHGSPSPKLLNLYLNQHGINIKELEDLQFRVKSDFDKSGEYHSLTIPGIYDRYTESFLKQLNYSESCYDCQFASFDRISDLTLGDSWGTDLDKEEQKNGISLILRQSKKGQELLDMANLNLLGVDIDKAIKNNRQLQQPAKRPKVRNKFFKMIKKGKNYNSAVFACYPKTFFKQDVKYALIKLKLWNEKRNDNISYAIQLKQGRY